MFGKKQEPKTEAELVAKGDAEAKARVEFEAKLKAEQKPLGFKDQLKAAVSPQSWAQVEVILKRIEADPSPAQIEKAMQQLGGFYSGKLLAEIKKNYSK